MLALTPAKFRVGFSREQRVIIEQSTSGRFSAPYLTSSMNTTDRISPALLGLTFIGLSAIAGAQQPGLPAPGAPPLAPASRQSTSATVQPAAPEKAVNVLERFTTSDMPLSDVISALQGQLRERNLPRLNILLAPGAEHLPYHRWICSTSLAPTPSSSSLLRQDWKRNRSRRGQRIIPPS